MDNCDEINEFFIKINKNRDLYQVNVKRKKVKYYHDQTKMDTLKVIYLVY